MLEDRRDASVEQRVQRVLEDDFTALMREHFRPPDLTRYRRELGIIVDRARARFAAWYETFPRSSTLARASAPRHGTLGGRSGSTSAPRRARLRRRVSGADSSDRSHVPQRERTIRSRLSPVTSGVRGRSATSTAATRRSSRRSARSTTSIVWSSGAQETGPRDRARLRAAVLARSSVGAGAPRLVSHPSGRHDQVRRESAEEVSGHLSAEFLVRRSAEPLERLPRRHCCSGSVMASRRFASTTRTRSRSPFGSG